MTVTLDIRPLTPPIGAGSRGIDLKAYATVDVGALWGAPGDAAGDAGRRAAARSA